MTTKVRVDQNNAALNFFQKVVADVDVDERNSEIKKRLRKYGANVAIIDEYLGIEFEDEKHATLFEIEWS